MPRRPFRLLLLAFSLWLPLTAFAEVRNEVLTSLHMLDYVGVDYPEFVQNGQVLDEAEYREQLEFSARVLATLEGLPEQPGKAALLQQARGLRAAVTARADGAEVGRLTAALSRDLLRAYPVNVTPRRAPDVLTAAAIYETQCAACHGASGRGDGALAAGMEPPPINFHDLARQRSRSVFGLFNVITLGVAGTSMPNFAQLPEEQRWALAFYVSQLAYSDEQRTAGKKAWEAGGPAMAAVDSLEKLSSVTPAELLAAHGSAGENLMAWLRRNPQVVGGQGQDPLALSRHRLAESLRAYRGGEQATAMQLALGAYLEGFELAEAGLSAVDAPLMRRIESAMMAYRELIQNRAADEAVAAQEAELQALLGEAQSRLAGGQLSVAGSFVGSFIILAREGLEAILVLAAMVAFLRKAERGDALRYVHIGWIAALALGIVTWLVATYLIDISGATRELTEGLTALLAAAVLLSVGLWLHNKSYSNRWQQYVATRMQGALSGARLWGLTGLAFIAVYREVFETVLFYRALWEQGDHGAILAGFGAAALLLVAVAWAIFTYSMRLPIRQFFSASSALIVVLAVVFTGKGVAALQEAGALPVSSVDFISIPMLGIYPTWQVLLLQLAVLALVLGGFAWNHISARRDAG